MYKPKHFKTYELVPPEIYDVLGENSLLLLDEKALATLDQLRAYFGVATVNDWRWGGEYKESGFRVFDTLTGAKKSMHKEGLAFDVKFRDYTAHEVRTIIKKKTGLFPFIKRVENGTSWFHFDLKETGKQEIHFFNP